MSKVTSGKSKSKIGKLELNKETVRDLSESEAEGAAGGAVNCGSHHVCPTKGCATKVCYTTDCPPPPKNTFFGCAARQ